MWDMFYDTIILPASPKRELQSIPNNITRYNTTLVEVTELYLRK
jgi:hypothetical protein